MDVPNKSLQATAAAPFVFDGGGDCPLPGSVVAQVPAAALSSVVSRKKRMSKSMLIVAFAVLTLVGLLAFCLASVPRSSDVAMHIFSDHGFAQFRVTAIVAGVSASALDCFVLFRLYRLGARQQ